MTSIARKIDALTRTGGSLIGIGATAYAFSNFTAPTGVGGAGSVFDFQSATTHAGDATAAVAGLALALGTGSNAITAGALYRDMGDRYVFSANGETVAIVAGVQPLTNVEYEGSRQKFYTTIWSANPAASTWAAVGVARL